MNKTITISIRVTLTEHAKIKAAADKEGRSVSNFIARALGVR